MKKRWKLMGWLLAGIMLCSCSPAAQKQEEEVTEQSLAGSVLTDFLQRAKADPEISPQQLAQDLLENEKIPFAGASMSVEAGYLNGFTAPIEGFEEGATFGPMIGSIPFIGYVFKLEEGADAENFMQQLQKQADLRWNVCTQADEMGCESEGRLVCFVMSPAEFDE